jgi:hypothetical protein
LQTITPTEQAIVFRVVIIRVSEALNLGRSA